MADSEANSKSSIAHRIPTRVVHNIKKAAQEKIKEAEKKGDAVRRLNLRELLPDTYESLINAVGDKIREEHDPSRPKKAITIKIPLPTDEDFRMQIHVGGDIKKPKVLLEFGARF